MGRNVTLEKFNLSYSTQLSPPITATFDGQNYFKNCISQTDGVLILFDNPQLNVGQLKAHRQYTIDSSIFPDGERNIKQIEMLPIEIVGLMDKSRLNMGYNNCQFVLQALIYLRFACKSR